MLIKRSHQMLLHLVVLKCRYIVSLNLAMGMIKLLDDLKPKYCYTATWLIFSGSLNVKIQLKARHLDQNS